MGLYEDLTGIDIITPALGFMWEKGYILEADGKIRPGGNWNGAVESPWISTKSVADRHCNLWYRVYFKVYRIISRNCFNCWKIVARPSTVEGLFKLEKLQKKMDLPSKCGVEDRPYSKHKGCYLGFWYCPMKNGLEGAKKLHKEVSLRVKDELGLQTPVILKRGCTEMEDAGGPSNKWRYPEQQHFYENLLDSVWEIPRVAIPLTAMDIVTRIKWIRYAVEHRDPTAKKYFDSMKTFGVTDTVVYHDTNIQPDTLPKFKLLEEEEDTNAKIQRLPED